MIRRFLAVTCAATMLAAIMAAPADASSRRFWQGMAWGAGAAIVGSALFGAAARASIDPRWHGYAPVEGYYYYPTYAAAPLAPCPGGFWSARPTAFDAYGRPIRWGKPRFVCPPSGYSYSSYYWR